MCFLVDKVRETDKKETLGQGRWGMEAPHNFIVNKSSNVGPWTELCLHGGGKWSLLQFRVVEDQEPPPDSPRFRVDVRTLLLLPHVIGRYMRALTGILCIRYVLALARAPLPAWQTRFRNRRSDGRHG